MTNKQVEEVVVKLTRIAHPEDLGEQTSKLEEAIRTTLTTLTDRDKEIMQEIEKLEKQLHLSGHHLRRQALSDIKALLTPIKEIEMNTQENKDWVEEVHKKLVALWEHPEEFQRAVRTALQQAQERERERIIPLIMEHSLIKSEDTLRELLD